MSDNKEQLDKFTYRKGDLQIVQEGDGPTLAELQEREPAENEDEPDEDEAEPEAEPENWDDEQEPASAPIREPPDNHLPRQSSSLIRLGEVTDKLAALAKRLEALTPKA